MTIDENGIQLDSFADIFDTLSQGFKDIYGDDINIDQDTPDGQQIAIYANTVYDLQSLLAKIYNGFDPDQAEGRELDKILKLIATSRLAATKSTVDINITVSSNVILPSDYTVKDTSGQEWVVNQEETLTTGVNLISFKAVDWGAVEASADTITKPVTILTQVTSLTNPAAAIAGRNEETDIELRKRRNKLIGYNSVSTVGGVLGKLLKLDDVADAVIYENQTDVYDTTRDIDAHTMWIICEGGDINSIAEIIAKDKTIGCGLKGNIEETYVENFERSNGTFRVHYHDVKFDRPVEADVYMRMNVTKRLPTDIIDTDAIKAALAALEFNINQTITATELYATIYSAGTTFIASDLELSWDEITWVDDILTSDYDERPIIDVDNITITEV
ncbi:baseplate J/gp47 family protein [Sulfurimonas sp.]|uniref:baseplate J/gp47 family protein n=1 Tax=Sulfurimonas sp. TaxID=2022749 RepID=UPI0035671F9E